MTVSVRAARSEEWEQARDLRLRALADETDAHLYGMWVEPAWRRRGVGGSLVQAVVDWARSWSARAVLLGVTERNDGAAGFYERLGFADTGERHALREGGSLLTSVFRLEL